MSSPKWTFHRFIRVKTNRGCFGFILLALIFLLSSAEWVHAQVDVTEKVRKNTVLGKLIEDFCANYCQGNLREGRLTAVTLKPVGNGRYRGVVIAELRNRHEAGEPFNVVLYDWVVQVRAEGMVDSSTCVVSVDAVTVDDDIQGVFAGILDQFHGRKYRVSNCKSVLPTADPHRARLPAR